jgi:MbtH protein
MSEEDDRTFNVVVNKEEQYSLFAGDCEMPLGWREAGFKGKRQECLEWISRVWTDMRPLSLRRAMDQRQKE